MRASVREKRHRALFRIVRRGNLERGRSETNSDP